MRRRAMKSMHDLFDIALDRLPNQLRTDSFNPMLKVFGELSGNRCPVEAILHDHEPTPCKPIRSLTTMQQKSPHHHRKKTPIVVPNRHSYIVDKAKLSLDRSFSSSPQETLASHVQACQIYDKLSVAVHALRHCDVMVRICDCMNCMLPSKMPLELARCLAVEAKTT